MRQRRRPSMPPSKSAAYCPLKNAFESTNQARSARLIQILASRHQAQKQARSKPPPRPFRSSTTPPSAKRPSISSSRSFAAAEFSADPVSISIRSSAEISTSPASTPKLRNTHYLHKGALFERRHRRQMRTHAQQHCKVHCHVRPRRPCRKHQNQSPCSPHGWQLKCGRRRHRRDHNHCTRDPSASPPEPEVEAPVVEADAGPLNDGAVAPPTTQIIIIPGESGCTCTTPARSTSPSSTSSSTSWLLALGTLLALARRRHKTLENSAVDLPLPAFARRASEPSPR